MPGLDKPLEQLGFHNVGYGCMTCIGNSGPLPPAVAKAIGEGGLVAAAVLSGNRNFEGRIHPLTKANYLASPPLVVAYALAGTVDIDLTTEPLGTGGDGRPVFLKDLWPSPAEIAAAVVAIGSARDVSPPLCRRVRGERDVEPIAVSESELFPWDPGSTYIQEPPFLAEVAAEPGPIRPIQRRSRAGDVRRFGHDRPHFAGGLDRRHEPGRQVLAGARRQAGRFQQLRIAARQRSGDGRAARSPTSASATCSLPAPKGA